MKPLRDLGAERQPGPRERDLDPCDSSEGGTVMGSDGHLWHTDDRCGSFTDSK